MRLSIALICAAALAAIVPPAAAACAPAICQYVENPPSANGHNPSQGQNPNGPNSLSRKTQNQLDNSATGRAAANAANATAPKSQGGKQGKNVNNKGKHNNAATKRRNLPSQGSGAAGSGSGGGSGGGGGIGIVLPVILGLSLLAAAGYAMWRRGVFRNFDLGSVFNRRGDVGG
jgi:hypothetical protein